MSATAQEKPIVESISLDTREFLDNSMPFLQGLRDHERVVHGLLPDDSPFPGEHINIKPFYMNRGDPPELGVWQVELGGKFSGRLTTAPSVREGIHYKFSVKDGTNIRDANAQEFEQLATMLFYVGDNCPPPEPEVEAKARSPKRNRMSARIGNAIAKVIVGTSIK